MCSQAEACTGTEDNVLDTILGVGEEEECQLLCQQDTLCQIYTWYLCRLLNDEAMFNDATEFLANFCVLLR